MGPTKFHGHLMRSCLSLLCLLSMLTLAAWGQENPAAPGPSEKPSPQAQLAYRFIAGGRTTYEIAYESKANADLRVLFQDQGGQAPAQSSSLVYDLGAELRGQWVATITDADAERVRVFYELHHSSVRVTVNGQEQAAQAEGVQTTLTRGVLVEMSLDGKILAVTVDSMADKFSRDFALSLLGITEFVLPAAGETATSSWQSREEDRTGAYSARYSVSAQTAGQSSAPKTLIRKTKLRYFIERPESTLPGQVPAQKLVLPKGTIEARFDPGHGQLASLSGTETQDTIINTKNVAHSAITLHLTRTFGGEVAREILAKAQLAAKDLAAKGSRLALYTRASPQEMQSSIQRTQLGSETLDSLLAQLAAVEKLRPKDDQTNLYLKFKALIYLHPESCARLGSLLATADPASPTFVILARALGAVANAPAQDALIAAIQARPGDLIAVANLVPTLAEAPAPTINAEETIRQLAKRSSDSAISATALLSLGTMAHGLARKSPARSSRIVHDLLLQAGFRDVRPAGPTQSEDRTHDVIEALGNTRSAAALPALAAFAVNTSPRLRAAALDALRFMPAPRADALLIQALGDSDGTPRLEAAYGLSFRKMTAESFAAQRKALLKDDNDKVRATLLANLWKVHAQFPEARALVETASEQDPSEYVRKVAKGMLTESPAP